jgi:hypothetical protein
MWEDAAMAILEVPLANPIGSPKQVPAEYYYRVPVRPIYKSYPIYAPGRGPAGYLDGLKSRDPEIVWDDGAHRPRLESEADWVKAGELVFMSPEFYEQIISAEEAQNPQWFEQIHPPLTAEGAISGSRYVVRTRGRVEVGSFGCATCHTRVMSDGSVVNGAQGNFPVEAAEAYRFRHRITPSLLRVLMRGLFSVPWLDADPHAALEQFTPDEIGRLFEAIPPGVIARGQTSPLFPVQAIDLVGVKDRKYLDHTGLQLNRGIVDLMRYSALNQGMDDLASYNGFVPRGKPGSSLPPEPPPFMRYSDEQLYALVLYLYSLKPPPNPNPFNESATRGKKVFEREGCANCHTPPLYTNNKLTLAKGFEPGAEAIKRYDIMKLSVGTDPSLALLTRRGTGYYKVPSLKGVWYRGMFGHGGWCATLEDWFEPRRLEPDYVPTGFKGSKKYQVDTGGHLFGTGLSITDKEDLIRFLKTL